jgi:hypothetical protein
VDDGTWFKDFLAVMDGADIQMRFWVCPDGHSDGAWAGISPAVTVAWDGDVARCLAPGCGRTSSGPR